MLGNGTEGTGEPLSGKGAAMLRRGGGDKLLIHSEARAPSLATIISTQRDAASPHYFPPRFSPK